MTDRPTTYILAIGNSFSQDATTYLHRICDNLGFHVFVVNLYIGGCSLERHWINIERDEKAYQYQENGVLTDRYVSIPEVLREKPWDFIVTQQASHDSGWLETYEPFAGMMIEYLRSNVPGAKICLHQTWAYEAGSDHENFMRYNRDQQEMYRRSRESYHRIAEKYGLTLIPCGDVVQDIRKHPEFDVSKGGRSICRDGFHMSYLYGRYALGCVWAKILLHAPIGECTFLPHSSDTEEELDRELLSLVKEEADKEEE